MSAESHSFPSGIGQVAGVDHGRAAVLERRHAAIDRMLNLREKAIAEGMELWDEDRLLREMALRRGGYASED